MSRETIDYQNPFSARLIRSGVDRCFKAMAVAKAAKEGLDPDDAADIAEGETNARRQIRAIGCRHCRAGRDNPCRRVGSRMEQLTTYHDVRVTDALGV